LLVIWVRISTWRRLEIWVLAFNLVYLRVGLGLGMGKDVSSDASGAVVHYWHVVCFKVVARYFLRNMLLKLLKVVLTVTFWIPDEQRNLQRIEPSLLV
jgi:hypothetical protein